MPLSYALSFVVAAVVSAALTPIMQRLSLAIGAVSLPGGRNVNAMQMPRLGGPALFLGATAGMILLFCLDGHVSRAVRADSDRALGFFLPALMMLVTGAVDDIRSLAARHKLLAQILAACTAYAFGLRLDVVELPLLPPLELSYLALPATVVWIVGVTNAINLIDGLDGLAAGVVFFAAASNFVVGYMNDSFLVAALMSCLVGSVLGFLFFNFNPARIFMGDSGSYFLGFLMAATAIAAPFQKASAAVSLLTPVLALGVPITDTLFAMLRRILERRSIFSPDRGHIHHRLLDMGLTHRRAVLAIYGASAVLCVLAIVGSIRRDWQIGFSLAVLSVLIFGVVRAVARPRYVVHRAPQAAALRAVLPLLPSRLQSGANEDEVLAVLEALVDELSLRRCELISVNNGRDELIRVFEPKRQASDKSSSLRIAAACRVSLGPESKATVDIRYLWVDEYGGSADACAPLLQVVTDLFEQALRRVGSRLVVLDV